MFVWRREWRGIERLSRWWVRTDALESPNSRILSSGWEVSPLLMQKHQLECTGTSLEGLLFEVREADRPTSEKVGVGFCAELRECRVKEVRMDLVTRMPKEPGASVCVQAAGPRAPNRTIEQFAM